MSRAKAIWWHGTTWFDSDLATLQTRRGSPRFPGPRALTNRRSARVSEDSPASDAAPAPTSASALVRRWLSHRPPFLSFRNGRVGLAELIPRVRHRERSVSLRRH